MLDTRTLLGLLLMVACTMQVLSLIGHGLSYALT
jgi:hypothetical protein